MAHDDLPAGFKPDDLPAGFTVDGQPEAHAQEAAPAPAAPESPREQLLGDWLKSKARNALLGVGAGASGNFSDELAGVVGAVTQPLANLAGYPEQTMGQAYRETRDLSRKQHAEAKKEDPWLYGGAQVLGGIGGAAALGGSGLGAVDWATKGARAIKQGAVVGGIAGLGGGESDLTRGDVGGAAVDTAVGSGLGALGSWLVPKATEKAAAVLKNPIAQAKAKIGSVLAAPERLRVAMKGSDIDYGGTPKTKAAKDTASQVQAALAGKPNPYKPENEGLLLGSEQYDFGPGAASPAQSIARMPSAVTPPAAPAPIPANTDDATRAALQRLQQSTGKDYSHLLKPEDFPAAAAPKPVAGVDDVATANVKLGGSPANSDTAVTPPRPSGPYFDDARSPDQNTALRALVDGEQNAANVGPGPTRITNMSQREPVPGDWKGQPPAVMPGSAPPTPEPAQAAHAPSPAAGDYAAQLKQRILDAQKANPEAVAAFGADPRAGERGFLGLGDAYAAAKALQNAGPIARKAMDMSYKLGSSMEQSGQDAIRKSALRAAADPKRIHLLANEPGAVGDMARRAIEVSKDPAAFAARSYMLTLMPEFRKMIAGQDEQRAGE